LARSLREREARIAGLEDFIADHHVEGQSRTVAAAGARGDGPAIQMIEEPPGGVPVPLLEAAPLARRAARLICFYLPQFHAIPENDDWWGTGFTEWTNVRAARPLFEGHAQPERPGELGYYNLLEPRTLARQVELARLYGIEGFCFYFYWFGGKRLLEAPLERYLADASLDLPFCLCWANENWTRRWDGLENEILIGQSHSPEDDVAFIDHVAPYLRDPRYIRVDGRPLLLVYRPGLFPDAPATAARWRARCRETGIGEIFLAYTQSFDRVPPEAFGFDAAIEFPPDYASQPDLTARIPGMAPGFRGVVHDWRILVERSRAYMPAEYTLFRGINPGWDNTPRRGIEAKIYCNSSALGYQEWLYNAVVDARERFADDDRRLLFINAWNEWAEGAFLEPDARRGYARLEATRLALVRAALAQAIPPLGPACRLAIVAHAFHLDVFDRILDYLRRLDSATYRLFVTCAPERADAVRRAMADAGIVGEVCEFANRGRDVLPFLRLLPRLLAGDCEVILKVHTKKSDHRRDGELWVVDLFDKLLTAAAIEEACAHLRTHPGTGIVGPRDHVIPMTHYWGRNAATVKRLAARLGVDAAALTNASFVAGTMFFCRPQALAPLAELALPDEEFERESGQIDGTMAHAIERLFAVSALSVSMATRSPGEPADGEREYRFAAPTRLPPELAAALLQRTDSLVERLRVTDAAMARAQSLALERLDEIEALVERLEATENALGEAQALALGRLDENAALQERVRLTEHALRDAERLAIERLDETTALQQRVQLTEEALRRAETLAHGRLVELEQLERRVAETEAALRAAERLAHGRLDEIDALRREASAAIQARARTPEGGDGAAGTDEAGRAAALRDAEAQRALAQALADLSGLRAQATDAEARVAQRDRQLREAAEALAQAQGVASDLAQQLDERGAQVRRSEADLAAARDDSAALAAQLAQARTDLAAREQAHASTRDELDALRRRLAALGDAIAAVEARTGWRLAAALRLVTPVGAGGRE
ncbi:MAG: glycoside hydrolase family 99-like domain-containing protein, partial [Burkholderiales bacterium]|nr:glycoside hydrolase family 99-like domain-containing protein [Burkholderiales bacterium]